MPTNQPAKRWEHNLRLYEEAMSRALAALIETKQLSHWDDPDNRQDAVSKAHDFAARCINMTESHFTELKQIP